MHNRRGGKFRCYVQLLRGNALFLWRHEDTSSSRLLSDDIEWCRLCEGLVGAFIQVESDVSEVDGLFVGFDGDP